MINPLNKEYTVKMKNTLIVIAEQAAANYRAAMMEHFYCDMGFIHPKEFATDIEMFGKSLLNMCGAASDSLKEFRAQFRNGSTMMLVEDEQMDHLEELSRNDEDFRIAIFKEDGTAVGIVNKSDITW